MGNMEFLNYKINNSLISFVDAFSSLGDIIWYCIHHAPDMYSKEKGTEYGIQLL